jgi:myo-inositol-1-phosphate synthase
MVGVGNCASSLVQGLTYYRDAQANTPVPGLMNIDLGGYHVGDVEIASAFDVNARKVGLDVADAILAPPNNTHRFSPVAPTRVTVERGPTLDGIGKYSRDEVPESDKAAVDVAEVLADTRTGRAGLLPARGIAEGHGILRRGRAQGGCAFVNCVPVFIASDPAWSRRFSEARLPIVGDDIKSQVGATIVHRTLANLMRERGVRLDRTYQLNFGGNSDFQNMLERERLESKKISKTQAVASQLDVPLEPGDIHIGPSDFVPWLTDRKWAYIRLEGTTFGGVPLNMEVKLEVWDSPNSAGVVIDAVRCAKLGMDRGQGGPLIGPSSWFMKSPPEQFTDEEARERTLRFIAGEA